MNIFFYQNSYFFQPFLGSCEASNRIVGKLKCGSDTIATLDGRWDQEIHYKDKNTGVRILFNLPGLYMIMMGH